MVMIGDLVKTHSGVKGIVVSVRRGVLGGSGIISYTSPTGSYHFETTREPSRDQLLVIGLDSDMLSWFDEASIEVVSSIEQ